MFFFLFCLVTLYTILICHININKAAWSHCINFIVQNRSLAFVEGGVGVCCRVWNHSLHDMTPACTIDMNIQPTHPPNILTCCQRVSHSVRCN